MKTIRQIYCPNWLVTTLILTSCLSVSLHAVSQSPSLNGGVVDNPSQTVNIGYTPAKIMASYPSGTAGGGCDNRYEYQWEQSTDNINFTTISGATEQTFQPGPLTQTTYYRRKVIHCTASVYTSGVAIVTVGNFSLTAGCITSGDQQINYNTFPSTIDATVAGGGCGSALDYQWQVSLDNVFFIDIPGAKSEDLSFSNGLTQTRYYQRKVSCGSETKYTSSVKVTVGANINYQLMEDSTGHGHNVSLHVNYNRTNWSSDAPPLTPATNPTSSLVLIAEGYGPQQNITSVFNNFTMELWVKPDAPHEIDPESQTGHTGVSGQRYVIFPGHTGMGNTTEAGVGLSVGVNGISVYEHSDNYMPPLLVWQGTLSGWTHVAVVYENKQPSLYVNGLLARTGLISHRIYCYPSKSFPGGHYGNMVGKLDEVRIWDHVRTPQQIQSNMNTSVSSASSGLVAYWPLNKSPQ